MDVDKEYIKKVFSMRRKSKISFFLTHIKVVKNNEDIIGAYGYSFAEKNKLFVENYFSNTIEKEISLLLNKKIERKSIVEIGNLAIENPINAIKVYQDIIKELDIKNIDYAVFTTFTSVANKIKRLGFNIIKIKDVFLTDVDEINQDDWGSYYNKKPKVYLLMRTTDL